MDASAGRAPAPATLAGLGLPAARCDLERGHEQRAAPGFEGALHQYLSQAGTIVTFSYVEIRDGTTRDLAIASKRVRSRRRGAG